MKKLLIAVLILFVGINGFSQPITPEKLFTEYLLLNPSIIKFRVAKVPIAYEPYRSFQVIRTANEHLYYKDKVLFKYVYLTSADAADIIRWVDSKYALKKNTRTYWKFSDQYYQIEVVFLDNNRKQVIITEYPCLM